MQKRKTIRNLEQMKAGPPVALFPSNKIIMKKSVRMETDLSRLEKNEIIQPRKSFEATN